ncbi:MAG: hypothetical protein ACRDV8_13985, partial [Acidimicrobiales bacterium]
ALPPLGVVLIVAVALGVEPSFLEWMGVERTAAEASATALGPWLVPSLLLAFGALALVVWGARLAPRRRGALAAAFVVVDLAVFAVTTIVAVGAPHSGTGTSAAADAPSSASPRATASLARASTARLRPIAALHLPGRFAVYDPRLLYASELDRLGVPDASALDGTWSVQGYGSIVDGHYAAETGVHDPAGRGQDVFSATAAAGNAFDSLSTVAVLAPSQYLITADKNAHAAARPPGTRRTTAVGTASWLFGTPLQVRSARVKVRVAGTSPPTRGSHLRVGLFTRTGRVDWAPVEARRAVGGTGSRGIPDVWDAAWHSSVDAVGLVVSPNVRATISPPVVEATSGRWFALDGMLQDAIVAPHWRYGTQDGAFAVFVDVRARSSLSLRALPGQSLRGAAVRRLSGPTLEPRTALVSSPHGVDVVRAVAAEPGWTAWWAPSSTGAGAAGPSELALRRSGVVQMVRVPAGQGVLTWRYTAPGLLLGATLSAVALALLAVLVVLLVVSRTGRARAHRAHRAHQMLRV